MFNTWVEIPILAAVTVAMTVTVAITVTVTIAVTVTMTVAIAIAVEIRTLAIRMAAVVGIVGIVDIVVDLKAVVTGCVLLYLMREMRVAIEN